MINFRTRSDNSLLFSTIKVKDIIKKAKDRNERSVILIDKETMFGAVDFYKRAQKEELNPILGLELKMHLGESLKDRNFESHPIILIALNKEGYQNIMYLSSMAMTDGFYRNARINLKTLIASKSGIVVIEPVLDGKAQSLSKGERKSYVDILKNEFNENFFIGVPSLSSMNKSQLELISDLENQQIKSIPAQEQVFIEKGDEEAREIYRIIGNKKQNEFNGLYIEKNGEEFHLASEETMKEYIGNDSAIKNAESLLQRIDLDLGLGDPIPPKFKYTKELSEKDGLKNATDAEYFEFKCKQKLEVRLENVPKERHEEYKTRLDYEINIINRMKFPGYMLIVWDFVVAAKEMGIAIGPGRGSAAGSLVAYALKITNIDPMKYDLLFERFLNPERVSMPDIDMDFMQARRGEIISYVVQKYGYNKVAQISTFSTLLPKGEVKDIGKILGVSYSQTDALSKMIPDDAKTLNEAIERNPELNTFFHDSARGEKVLSTSNKLEGLQRNTGLHAAGVVISDEPLWEKTPIYKSDNESSLVTQYSLNFLEDVDLIKFDFLGLKTLDVIDNAIKMACRNHKVSFTESDIDIDDPVIYDMLSSGETIGLFQVESTGMQALNKKMKPDGFEDLIAVLALYRPGPMNSGMLDDFVERKHGRQEITYMFEEVRDVLDTTYGVPVYQEQIMKMVQVIGGFSLGGSDIVRRAMGKKKPEEMAKYRKEFVDGAIKQSLDGKKADELFDVITGFAEYGFNKSHSAAYAMITAQTAWLKYYYPAEFMAALMTSVHDDPNKLPIYLKHAIDLGIEIIPPSVNNPVFNFEVYNNKIFYGLEMVKGVGHPVAAEIIKKYQEGKGYETLIDFLEKVDGRVLKKDTLEFLIGSGALDVFTYSRRRLYENVPSIISSTQKYKNLMEEFNQSIFHMNSEKFKLSVDIPNMDPWTTEDEYAKEVKSLGIALSTKDPLADYKNIIQGVHFDDFAISVANKHPKATLLVNIDKVDAKQSKKGNTFYIIHATDSTGSFSGICFGSIGKNYIDAEQKEKQAPWKVEIDLDITEEKTSIKFNSMESEFIEGGVTSDSVKSYSEVMALFIDDSEEEEIRNDASSVRFGFKRLIFLKKTKNTSKYEVIDSGIDVDDSFLFKYKDSIANRQYLKVKKMFLE